MFIADSAAVPFTPVSFLRDVRGACLARSETRMPIWRFRVAPDFLVQVQPRPRTERQAGIFALFHGIAIAVDRGPAVASMFTAASYEFKGMWARRYFEVVEHTGDKRWHLNRRGGFHHRLAQGDLFDLDRRLAKVFTGRFFDELSPESMLSPQCLVCGVSLSDPVSMARGVGPCCAATTSNIVPFTIVKRRRRS